MILSSADILRILGGSEIIRLSAKLKVVDGKPAISGAEGLFIFVNRFPQVGEFESIWTLWIESDGSEPDDLVIAEIKRLLPSVKTFDGLLTTITSTDFLLESTQRAPEAYSPSQAKVDLSGIEERFESLAEDIQDRMLLISSGRDGKDGIQGPAGADGRDGKDIDATETELFDLQDVDRGIPLQKGQVLTYDGSDWTNLFIPQLVSATTGGGGQGSTTFVSGQLGSTIVWQYHEETGEPHSRKFHTHGEDQADQVTQFHVSKTNEAGNEVELLLGALLPLTGQVYVANEGDPSQAHLYSVESYVKTTSGFELNVTHIETPGPEPSFITNDNYSFFFLPSASVTGGIPEAPVDGQQYARQNATWTPVSPGGIEEAPLDGSYYVRSSGRWVDLIDALSALGVPYTEPVDAGDFTTGLASAITNRLYDGADFTSNITTATDAVTLDGGLIDQ